MQVFFTQQLNEEDEVSCVPGERNYLEFVFFALENAEQGPVRCTAHGCEYQPLVMFNPSKLEMDPLPDLPCAVEFVSGTMVVRVRTADMPLSRHHMYQPIRMRFETTEDGVVAYSPSFFVVDLKSRLPPVWDEDDDEEMNGEEEEE